MSRVLLSEAEWMQRSAANDTACERPPGVLHRAFFDWAARRPDDAALFWNGDGGGRMTYGELSDRALALAGYLRHLGVENETLVAISMRRGPDQIAAVLGCLAAGASYVPVGVHQPKHRREQILRSGNIRFLIADARGAGADGLVVVCPEDADPAWRLPAPVPVRPGERAYVIFTSGTTGEPKGVEIRHDAAWNTVDDINRRFQVCDTDRVLAVSRLDFDLSVYDIFGLLSAGGALVLALTHELKDAQAWRALVAAHRVSIWNSVPALFEMFLISGVEPEEMAALRVALVSGDWVRPKLFDLMRAKTPSCRLIALGGATEASIWSNFFEVTALDPSWSAVPYGRPLSNQRFRIVDEQGRHCPDGVPGELQIGGRGLAAGYLFAPELTAQKFIEADGERWYRTGDLGQYLPDGQMMFLGRMDRQIKLRGYRIEAGEVEQALCRLPDIRKANVFLAEQSGGSCLAAAVVGPDVCPGLPALADAETALTAEEQAVLEAQSRMMDPILLRYLLPVDMERSAPVSAAALKTQLGVLPDFGPLIDFWLGYLVARGVLLLDGDVLRPGSGYAAARAAAVSSPFQRLLLGKKHLIESIYIGAAEAYVLLEDPDLSPEILSSKESGMQAGLSGLAGLLEQAASDPERPLRVAYLGCRSGVLPELLMRQVPSENIELVLMDYSKVMVEAARNRLRDDRRVTAGIVLPHEGLTLDSDAPFDIVLAVNVLHADPDLQKAVFTVSQLLRGGGRLLMLELSALPPAAALTAAVLERGYQAFDAASRPRPGDPMLRGAEWRALLESAGFESAAITRMPGTLFMILDAVRPAGGAELDSEQIKADLKAFLPDYMVPEKIKRFYDLPLSSNGKVDQGRIAAAFERREMAAESGELRTPMEETVAALWRETLELERVARTDTFFELGGDSLLASYVIQKLRERYGIPLTLKALFDHPTLAEVSAYLSEQIDASGTDGALEEGVI